jgi:D-threo-aldose 1-dehydrogenase
VTLPTRPLGRTGLAVTELGFGSGPLGGFRGRPVDDETAQATLAAAWEVGIRYFDTAPWYGLGASEHRVGRFLRSHRRDEYVLSTKVGRMLGRRGAAPGGSANVHWESSLPFDWWYDYRRDAVLRSFEDSLQRLGLERIDVLLIHDLEPGAHGGEEGARTRLAELDRGGGFEALAELRASGAVQGIGIGVNDSGVVVPFLERFDLDVVLQAGEYTLLEQRALEPALAACAERGVAVVVGAPFNSGLLASAAQQHPTFADGDATADTLGRVRRLRELCARHGVDVAAAALRFPLSHPAVASVIPGAARPDEVRENAGRHASALPEELWSELSGAGLLRADAPTPAHVPT